MNFDSLRSLIRNSHRYGSFGLSSGKTSNEYFDLAPLLLSNFGLDKICDAIDRLFTGIVPDAVACYELCPVPLIGAFVLRHERLHGLIVRKQRKDHGTRNLIEGCIVPGDRVVILEDVTSTGASVMKAVKALEGAKCSIVAIVTIINRQEGCDELLKAYNFKWLFTKGELNG
jgi:orotate phosphoribosyltransferase